MTLGPGRCEHLTGQLLALRGEGAAPRAVLCDYRSRELRSVAVGDQALVEAASPVHHDGMLPDTGRYEERYRLTSRDGAALGAGVFALLAGILLPNAVPFIVFGGAVTLLYIVVLAGHRVAFRADNAGIMLGVNLTGLKLHRVNIPGQMSRRSSSTHYGRCTGKTSSGRGRRRGITSESNAARTLRPWSTAISQPPGVRNRG